MYDTVQIERPAINVHERPASVAEPIFRLVLRVMAAILLLAAFNQWTQTTMGSITPLVLTVTFFSAGKLCQYKAFAAVTVFLGLSAVYLSGFLSSWQVFSWIAINAVAALVFVTTSMLRLVNYRDAHKQQGYFRWFKDSGVIWSVLPIVLWFAPVSLWQTETASCSSLYLKGQADGAYQAFLQLSKKIWFSFSSEQFLKELRETASQAFSKKDYLHAAMFYGLASDVAVKYNDDYFVDDRIKQADCLTLAKHYSEAGEVLKLVGGVNNERERSLYAIAQSKLLNAQELHEDAVHLLSEYQAEFMKENCEIFSFDLEEFLLLASSQFDLAKSPNEAEKALIAAIKISEKAEDWENCLSAHSKLVNFYQEHLILDKALEVQKQLTALREKLRNSDYAYLLDEGNQTIVLGRYRE